MKKTYVKPRAMMEYFTLSQSIAKHCGWNSDDYYGSPTHADNTVCGWRDAAGDVYWTSGAACSIIVDANYEIVGEVCYNAPTGSNEIFAS